ncbi:uncharacterized protein G2W53_028983 [Senna tora]|uniref:Uncharacterized protein n=1 Tax=Senna tora TaxID=362788 RepID=A0A834WFA8_9FABA|nr:uncharacterized protein G2W53_028983 [Senna tora]
MFVLREHVPHFPYERDRRKTLDNGTFNTYTSDATSPLLG